jgi:hypothetical protein
VSGFYLWRCGVGITNAGDAPKDTVQFAVGGNGGAVTNGWYDDVRFEPLAP